MSWILISEASVQPLIDSRLLRRALAAALSDPELAQAAHLSTDDGGHLSLLPIKGGSILVSAWHGNAYDQIPASGKLLAIWSAQGESTILTLPEEELPFALERICALSSRVWAQTPFPESWTPKKLADCQSIFLSGRLIDVRVAYSLQSIHDKLEVVVGTIFFAYRRQKQIRVPELDISALDLPARVTRPAGETDAMKNTGFQSDDPDVLINRGRGEDMRCMQTL